MFWKVRSIIGTSISIWTFPSGNIAPVPLDPLRGSSPYAGGMDGFRAGAGQGLAQGATNILDRFLNRLQTITIRAGHRLRIWLTSDVLVPRPA